MFDGKGEIMLQKNKKRNAKHMIHCSSSWDGPPDVAEGQLPAALVGDGGSCHSAAFDELQFP